MKTYINTILLGLILVSCSSEEQPILIDSSEDETTEELTSITKHQFEMQEMELDSITQKSFGGSIHCTGKIDVPPEYKADVSAYFGGYVKNIQLITGTFVKKGQALFYLENPTFIDIQREFLEKKNESELLKSEYDRQAELFSNNATSDKDLNNAKSAYEISLVSLNSLEKKIELMNLTPDKLTADKITSSISVRAPISGYVTAVNISKGMFLDPQQIAVSIEGMDHKHMELNVYEKELSNIQIGDAILMTTAGNADKVYQGQVYLIDKSIHPENRTVKIHGHFDEIHVNTADLLPQMFIEAEILTNSSPSAALPESAIVAQDEFAYVLMLQQESDNELKFIKKEVQPGDTHQGYTQILNPQDLPANAVYLTKGAFQLIQ